MATTKERILITLTPDMAHELTLRAKKEKSPRATVAARLVREALDDAEDQRIAAIVDKRIASTKTWLSSDEFWKQVARKHSK